jgi:hypothetical protein
MQNLIPTDSITDTKMAATLATLSLQFAKPGIFTLLDKDSPASTGGQAHYIFESSLSNTVRKYVKIYEDGVADVTLDEYLDTLKGKLSDKEWLELETKITEALVVYGKKILQNYSTLVHFIKSDVGKFIRTGGDPVIHKGEVMGLQNFAIKPVPKEVK